jgi:N-carbamoyl-L-amino-acid hydrolase
MDEMGHSATILGDSDPLLDGPRLWARLHALAACGGRDDGGVNRQALSEADADAWRLFIEWAAPLGIEASVDDACNFYLTLPGRDRSLPPLLLGSHLDSQPSGGRFDGAYGVMAAFETLACRAERQDKTPSSAPGTGTASSIRQARRDVVAVAWMNEEGSRFAPGMMGSRVFAGAARMTDYRDVTDADGVAVGEEADRMLAAFSALPRKPAGFPLAGYLELHIEQGPVLEATGHTIGVVTGIQGKRTWRVTIAGAAGHAGTVDTALRQDAMFAFARMAAALEREIAADHPDVKLTIGRVTVEPNAPSVIAQKVIFSVDLRHPENAILSRLGDRVAELCVAHAGPCRVDCEILSDAPSNVFDADWQGRIAAAAEQLGYPVMPILSAAGHDARYLAQVTPSAMIFIPCRDGVSHAPHEWSSEHDVEAGARVLAHVVDAWLIDDEALAQTLDGASQDMKHMASAPQDMAMLPVQLPLAPQSAAQERARFFNSGNAFDIALPDVPAARFLRHDRSSVCDQQAVLQTPVPATTPFMVARYWRLDANESIALHSMMDACSGAIWYVLEGTGTWLPDHDTEAPLPWAEGDVFLLPGAAGGTLMAGTAGAMLWSVDNSPLLAHEQVRPRTVDARRDGAASATPTGEYVLPVRPVHYPAVEIDRQLQALFALKANAETSGFALIFSSAELEQSRNLLPSLTLSLNTLPAGEIQRPHRHNSAALTLVLRGDDCYSMVDGQRCDWEQGMTLVTPAGAWHSHHNDGGNGIRARFLIVQDGGLYYQGRTMGFTFADAQV